MYGFDCSLQRNAKLQDADANAWWDTMCQLQKILRRAAQVLHAAKKLDDEGVHNYYMSGRTPVGYLPYRMTIYTEFNLVTWLKTVKFSDLNNIEI